VDSRAQVFTSWLASLDFDDESLQEITPAQALPLLGAFIHAVANEGFSKTRALTLTAATISGHLWAARDWLAAELGVVVDISADDGTAKLHPFLADTLAARQAWTAPKPKREPFTSDMFTYMFDDISKCAAAKPFVLFDLNAAIFDWTRLGTFTGSRVSEYAQTSARKGTFSRDPDSLDAGNWKNAPITFMFSDFTFLTKAGRVVSHNRLQQLGHTVHELHICFRFDKSPLNFTIRKFRRSGTHFLCPILGGISVILRAIALRVPPNEPIGVYCTSNKVMYTFLRSYDVITRMQAVCRLAHPDKDSFFYKNAALMVSHSNRVTAAVTLQNAGLSIDNIAFRLRWSPESVKHYLRDCSHAVGELTLQAVKGALLSDVDIASISSPVTLYTIQCFTPFIVVYIHYF